MIHSDVLYKLRSSKQLIPHQSRNCNGQMGEEGQIASVYQISWRSIKRLLRYRDFSICPRWRPSAILDLWCVCSDHTRRAFGGLYHCSKFGWNRCNSFDNMHVFEFASSAWKRLFTHQKLGFWGFDPKMESSLTATPQKTLPCVETERRHMTYRSSKSVDRCGLCANQSIK